MSGREAVLTDGTGGGEARWEGKGGIGGRKSMDGSEDDKEGGW